MAAFDRKGISVQLQDGAPLAKSNVVQSAPLPISTGGVEAMRSPGVTLSLPAAVTFAVSSLSLLSWPFVVKRGEECVAQARAC